MRDQYVVIRTKAGKYYAVVPEHYKRLKEWALKDHFRSRQFVVLHSVEDEEELLIDLGSIEAFFYSTPASRAAYCRWKEMIDEELEDNDKPEWMRD